MAVDRGEFEYDFALSFAGEDRPVVKRFAEFLEAKGFSVFYDNWKKAELWGRDLYQHLDEVYSKKARFCVMFLSANYAAKAWTNHELKSAQARAFQKSEAYILPVRLDDTIIPGIRPTLGYLDLRKDTVEEVAAIAVEKITAAKAAPAPPGKTRGKKAAPAPAKKAGGGVKKPAVVVETSQDWILLADGFYKALSVEAPDAKRFVVTLVTADAAANARLEAIRPQRGSGNRQFPFAYANDAFVVRCESASSTFEAGAHKWRVALLKEDIQYGGHVMESAYSDGTRHYTAEDFARMRAERILLGAAGPVSPAKRVGDFDVSGYLLESFIQGNNAPLKVTASPIQELAKKMPRDDAALYLTFARLLSLYYLKAGGVVERIERLVLGPLKKDAVHVAFRGLRRQKYENVAAERIELEGDCPLP